VNLTIDRQSLLTALTKVAGIVGRKTTVPILSNVLLDAGDGLTIHATNLDSEATVTAKADVTTPGRVCVPADTLLNIAKNAAEGADISMALDGDRLIVKSGRSRFKLATLPAVDFPTFAPMVKPVELTMSVASLQSLVGRTAFSVSKDATRFFITGVHLFSDGKTLGAVSTDGKRMTVYERVVAGKGIEMTIPQPFVAEIGKLTGETATIRATAEKLQVETADTVITGKLIDVPYAPWKKVIPSDLPNVATVDCDALLACLRRVQLAIEDESHSCRLSFSPGVIKAWARTSEADAADECEAEYDGPEVEIGMNSLHMIEALGALNADAVEIAFKDRSAGMTVRGVGDGDFVGVIMPLKV
jgi:DNA polymerase-3 subunit beta